LLRWCAGSLKLSGGWKLIYPAFAPEKGAKTGHGAFVAGPALVHSGHNKVAVLGWQAPATSSC